ncbi:unnamed protein product [Closterium sp. NIES-65]|nr:unnamed protein product [Closterium sp. NIES-65]
MRRISFCTLYQPAHSPSSLPSSGTALSGGGRQEYGSNKDLRAASRRRERKQRALLTDPALMHYALFSDNVLAVATVLRSLEANSKNPDRHVVHVVTDSMNLPAMQAWFALHPPAHVAVEITSVESLAFLNASYCPVLRQLQAKALKKFYFSQHDDSNQTNSGVLRPQGSAATEAEAAGAAAAAAVAGQKLKFKNPKYLSILNHLRFYLPEMFPALDRVVFLDDDVVVQRDLSPLFSLPLHGAVNGAVYTCREGDAFHRLHKYLNFSHPFIRDHFDPDGCGWAYGMNVFDLAQWRRKGLTDVYHKYQSMNAERQLWQLGTLPPGLMTFYNLTAPLDAHWHVLGLGYDKATPTHLIQQAAVLHYNGNAKPWLDTAIKEFKGLWSRYVLADDDMVQQCNIDLL